MGQESRCGSNFPRGAKIGFLFAPILLYLLIATWRLSEPGLYFDEVLFVNAALGCPHGELFVHKNWHGVPVMLMPYIGALKAWIYYPIFQVFDVSGFSVRLPMVLWGACSIGLTYLYASRLFSPMVGWIAACLLAVEPGFIFHTRWDWGPTALMMLFKSLFLVGICGP